MAWHSEDARTGKLWLADIEPDQVKLTLSLPGEAQLVELSASQVNLVARLLGAWPDGLTYEARVQEVYGEAPGDDKRLDADRARVQQLVYDLKTKNKRVASVRSLIHCTHRGVFLIQPPEDRIAHGDTLLPAC